MKILLKILLLLLISCEDIQPIDVQLKLNDDNYTRIKLNKNTWQTTYKITGKINANNIKVNWYCDHQWIIDDTIGYIIKETNHIVYVTTDTVYLDWFNKNTVDIINPASYSSNNTVSIMLAPVYTMLNDTINVWYVYEGKIDSIAYILSEKK